MVYIIFRVILTENWWIYFFRLDWLVFLLLCDYRLIVEIFYKVIGLFDFDHIFFRVTLTILIGTKVRWFKNANFSFQYDIDIAFIGARTFKNGSFRIVTQLWVQSHNICENLIVSFYYINHILSILVFNLPFETIKILQLMSKSFNYLCCSLW